MSLESFQSLPRRRGVVGVVVRAKRLLVIRRSHLVSAPLTLCFPGGGIETGETEQQALKREFQEELSATITPCCCLWHSVSVRNVEIAWWEATLSNSQKLVPDPQEVAAYFWMLCEEVRQHPDLLDSNRDFLEAWIRGDFAISGLNP